MNSYVTAHEYAAAEGHDTTTGNGDKYDDEAIGRAFDALASMDVESGEYTAGLAVAAGVDVATAAAWVADGQFEESGLLGTDDDSSCPCASRVREMLRAQEVADAPAYAALDARADLTADERTYVEGLRRLGLSPPSDPRHDLAKTAARTAERGFRSLARRRDPAYAALTYRAAFETAPRRTIRRGPGRAPRRARLSRVARVTSLGGDSGDGDPAPGPLGRPAAPIGGGQ